MSCLSDPAFQHQILKISIVVSGRRILKVTVCGNSACFPGGKK